MHRNLSVNAYFRHLAAKHTPRYRFAGESEQDWRKWHDALLPAAKQTLGTMPDPVPLNPQTVDECETDGLIKQRVLFDVEDGLSASAYVLRPAGVTGKLPAILACHGHGSFGKETLVGNDSSAELRSSRDHYNCGYGVAMAKAGYAVIAIDWRGFGERDDRHQPQDKSIIGNRDLCNLHYLRATMLGMTVLGMNVHDGGCALDYLCEQDFVDGDRIGVMGLSFGGTMATWISICDLRISATNIMCYSDRFADFAFRDIKTCGSQITPGLYAIADLPDLHGLIAPRPLLVEIGTLDGVFQIDSAMSCYHEVEKIYAAAGAANSLQLDLFEGKHQWSGRSSAAFFARHLK